MIDLTKVEEVKLEGLTVTVPVLPLSKILKLQKKVEEVEGVVEEDPEKQLEVMSNIVLDVLQNRNPELKYEDIYDNLTLEAFTTIVQLSCGTYKA